MQALDACLYGAITSGRPALGAHEPVRTEEISRMTFAKSRIPMTAIICVAVAPVLAHAQLTDVLRRQCCQPCRVGRL